MIASKVCVSIAQYLQHRIQFCDELIRVNYNAMHPSGEAINLNSCLPIKWNYICY